MSEYLKTETEDGTPFLIEVTSVQPKPKPKPKTVEYYAFLSVEFKRPVGPGSWQESFAYFGQTFTRDADTPLNRSDVFPWLIDRFWEHNPSMANRWDRDEMKVIFFDVNRNEL